jgi:hypothetical protein
VSADELYEAACLRWAANWLTSKGIVGEVRHVDFDFHEAVTYSEQTSENGWQMITIMYDAKGPWLEEVSIDLVDGDAPTFGALVQQICAAYDEVRANKEQNT